MMQKSTVSASILLALCLLGCTGIPPDRLKIEGITTVVESPMPLEFVYRRIVEGSRACFVGVFEVTADFFPTNQTGNVTASMKSLSSPAAAYVIDIAAAGSGSKVVIASHPSAPAIPGIVRSWVETGNYTACKLR